VRPSHRIFFGFVTARLVFGVVFLVSVIGRWPVFWYLPLQHRWEYARAVPGVAMDWYGRSGLSLAAGGAAGLVAYVLAGIPRVARVVSRKGVVVGVAHFGALMLLNDVVFYSLSLLTRHVTPPALPTWYCPR
jgi:hypothetical protein